MATSTKVLDLAKAEIKKTDGDKALDALTERVEDNKMQWMNELHSTKKSVTDAKKSVNEAKKNPNISGLAYVQLERNLALAQANLDAIQEAFNSRF